MLPKGGFRSHSHRRPHIRIERSAKFPSLTPRVTRFLKTALGGQTLDDIESPNTRRVDFSCLRGLVAIEVKSLNEPPNARIQNVVDEQVLRGDWPQFLGPAPLESFIRKTHDPAETSHKMAERIGRAIQNHLKKADKQLAAHASNHPRPNLVRLVFLLDEDHEEYTPDMAAFTINQFFLRRDDKSEPRYKHIDATIYLTERYATYSQGRLTFPVLALKNDPSLFLPWKASVIHFVLARWAAWNASPLFFASNDSSDSFQQIFDVPAQMSRGEQWRLDYARRQYMTSFSTESLREKFDEHVVHSVLFAAKHAPARISQVEFAASQAVFAGVVFEMSKRAITADDFRLDPDRIVKAAIRMKLSLETAYWVAKVASNGPP